VPDLFQQFQYPTAPLGTSASGFAAEVAAEQAVARLDYTEELYRDWLTSIPGQGIELRFSC
jgi:hypothetical protein